MTIYALSSGPGVSGIAVIRVSGKNTAEVIKKLTGSKLPQPRVATLKKFNKNGTEHMIKAQLNFSFHRFYHICYRVLNSMDTHTF